MQFPSFPRRPRYTRVALLSLLVAAALPLAAAVLEGCGASNETSGKRLTLHTRVAVSGSARSFTTPLGWHVTLDSAAVAGGPLYYFDGAPPLVSRARHSEVRFTQRWLGVATAHAHPGHYQAGNALGQMLEPWSADLFEGTQNLAEGEGVSGTYRSARFSLSAQPSGDAARVLGSASAIAVGVAERDGEEARFFRAIAEFDEVTKSSADGNVDGCEFHETHVDSDGTVHVEVRPEVWFELVDFAEVAVGTSDAPAEFEADSQPKLAFAQGVARLSAYKFSFIAD